MPKFDIAAALADGYSYSEIASYLSDLHGFDLNAAKYDGVGEEEVAGFLSAREVKPLESGDRDIEGGFMSSAKSVVGQTARGAGRVASDFFGADHNNAVSEWGQGVVDANPLAVRGIPDILSRPGTAITEAVGNAAPPMAGMVGARLVGQGITALSPLAGPAAPVVAGIGRGISWLGPAAIAALPSYSGIRDKQILKDAAYQDSAKAKAIAALGAGTVGFIEQKFGPQNWAMAALTKEGREELAKKLVGKTIEGSIGKGILRGGVEEGAEELVQNPVEQVASFEDPSTPESVKETLFGGAMGAIGGTVLGAGGGALSYATRTPEQTGPDPYVPSQMPDFEADRQRVEGLQVPTPIIPPLQPADFAGISAVPDALSAMTTQPTVTAKVDTATQQVENATTPKGYGNPLDTAGEIITAVRGADEAKLAELEKAIETPELDDFAASIRGDITDRREELARGQEILPADPQPDSQLIDRTLAAINTADQDRLNQMADDLPGISASRPEYAPFQKQLSEAITARQRVLWEESNVGRGTVQGDQGGVAAVQPEQPAGVRYTEPVSEDSWRQGDGAGGAGIEQASIGSVLPEQGSAPEVEQASPLLTAARQHVAETGDMTMGGLMKALDVDIDTAADLLEQVKATTPLPRNIAGTQAATRGADTGGFLNEQAIRKTGATSLATTAGDAQGFLADQGVRKATGTATAATGADTEGFVRDQQIRRDAMGAAKPTRAADEPARAFLARKREWEAGESTPPSPERGQEAGGSGQVEEKTARLIEQETQKIKQDGGQVHEISVGGRTHYVELDAVYGWKGRGRAATLRDDKWNVIMSNPNNTERSKKGLVAWGEREAARAGNPTKDAAAHPTPKTTSTAHPPSAEGATAPSPGEASNVAAEMKKLVASIKKSDAKLEKLHEGQLARMENGGQSRATSTTYAARSGNEAKHRDGEARVLANIARAELRDGRAVPQDVLDILGSKIEYNRSGDYEPIASNIKATAGGEDGETLRRGEEGTADYGTTTNGAGGQKNATRGGAAGSGRAADVDQPQREQWELTAAEWEKAHARDRRLEREAIEKVDRLKRQPRPKSVSANLRYLEKISAAEKVLREASENADRWGGEAVRKEVVRRAYESGRPVPSVILAEFPDIASNIKATAGGEDGDRAANDNRGVGDNKLSGTTVGQKTGPASIRPADRAGDAKASGWDSGSVLGGGSQSLPTGYDPAADEARFYGSRVTIKEQRTRNGKVVRGEIAGQVERILKNSSGGYVFEVVPDGYDSSSRYDDSEIVINELVDNKPEQKKTVESKKNGRPAPGRFAPASKEYNSTAQGQKDMAARGRRIATLKGLNRAVGDVYTDVEIDGAADENIDSMLDYLIEQQRSHDPEASNVKQQQSADIADVPETDFGEKKAAQPSASRPQRLEIDKAMNDSTFSEDGDEPHRAKIARQSAAGKKWAKEMAADGRVEEVEDIAEAHVFGFSEMQDKFVSGVEDGLSEHWQETKGKDFNPMALILSGPEKPTERDLERKKGVLARLQANPHAKEIREKITALEKQVKANEEKIEDWSSRSYKQTGARYENRDGGLSSTTAANERRRSKVIEGARIAIADANALAAEYRQQLSVVNDKVARVSGEIKVIEKSLAAQPSASKATPEKPAGVATSGQRLPVGTGARKQTAEGKARVDTARAALRELIRNPDIVGKDRADRIANAKSLVGFLQANAAKDLDTGYERGQQVAYTGEDAPEGMRSFIYLEGPKAGEYGVAATPEKRGEDAQRESAAWQRQQDGFRRVREGQERAAKEPWQMTREEYLADALERSEYRDKYKANPELLPPFEENTEREWRRSVEKAAETTRIPDTVLDSYLDRYGKQVFSSTFRGVAEKGVQGYLYPDVRAEQEPALAEKKKAVYDLKPYERTWAQQRGEERKAMSRDLTRSEWAELREQHKTAVQKAIWAGFPVPANVLADYPELADAKTRKDADMADAAQPAQAEAASGERGDEDGLVEHTTKRGKVLRGRIVTGISYRQAKEADPYTFKKDGGFFVREGAGEVKKDDAPAEVKETAPEKAEAQPKENLAIKRLRISAERLKAAGEAKLNQDRNANTARRARMANNAEADARADIRTAETLLNIVNAQEDGTAGALAGLTSKAQLETLQGILTQAKYAEERNKEYGKHDHARPANKDDIKSAVYPYPHFYDYKDLDALIDLLGNKKGWRTKRNDLRRGGLVVNGKERIEMLRDALKLAGDDYRFRTVGEHLKGYDRLQKAGITDDLELREALERLVELSGKAPEKNRAQELERALVGQNNGIDFFPTPKTQAKFIVDRAGIEPGMRVLEPSAGTGNLAEEMRAQGGEVDVAEISPAHREVLEAKGFKIVEHDFMDMEEGGYDVIVMNPPFSNNMDIDHVRKAYELLKPGGRVVAIMGEGAFFRTGKKETEFREWLDEVGINEKLPEGFFTDKKELRTTGVNARVVEIDKPAGAEDTAPDEKQEAVEAEQAEPAEAPAVEAETVTEQRLLDTGFLREFRDRWQYKFAGNNGWFTADRKEDAVERAQKAYEKTPESERLTAQERFDKSTAEQNADMERLYGDKSLPELRKEYARMEREIASLQKSGRREFDGNGGRRTSAAVSSEGARNIGGQKLKLGRYIEDMEKAEKESTPTRLHTVSGYPNDNATKKHMLEAIAEARKELPEPSPKDVFSNAERIDWPKPTTEKSRKIYRLAGNFKLVVDPNGYARLVEDMGSDGKTGDKIPDKVHGKPIGDLAEAKLWAEYYLLGKTEPSGPPHVFRGKDKEYEYTIPNSAYALDNFEKRVKGSSRVKFSERIGPTLESIKAKYAGRIDTIFVHERSDGDIHLASVIVSKGNRQQGIGSEFMADLVAYADANGKRVVLSPGQPDDRHGTTSRARLVRFYKRFGFIENKGRNKDYQISEGMYRAPAPKFSTALPPSSRADIPGELSAKYGGGIYDQLEQRGFKVDEKAWEEIDELTEATDGAFDAVPWRLPDALVGRDRKGRINQGGTPRSDFELAERLARIFNKRVIWATFDGRGAINGVVVTRRQSLKDRIFINPLAQNPAHVVFGHELSHWMEVEHPDIYADLYSTVEPLIVGTDEYRAKVSHLKRATNYDVNAEIIGDLLGDSFSDPKFWNLVAEQAGGKKFRGIAKKVMQWVNSVIDKIKGLVGYDSNPLVKDLRKTKVALARAVARYAKAQPKAGVTTSEQAMFSVRDLFKPVDTNSAAFREWARGSVVRDIQYHWTDAEFDAFDMEASGGMVHFGTKQAAADRAGGQDGIGYDIEEDDGEFWVYADAGPSDGEGVGPFRTESEAKKYIKTQPKRIEPIAVYLNIKNPIRVPDFGVWTLDGVRTYLYNENVINKRDADKIWKAWQNSSKDGYEALRLVLEKKGYDGFVYENEQEDPGSDSYVVLSPTQIKSATENTGSFSPSDPRIRYSKQFDDGEADERNPLSWDAPLDSKKDSIIYNIQNKFIDLFRTQDAIQKHGGTITEETDVRLAEELYHKRSAKRVDDFLINEVKPLMAELAEVAQDEKEFERFLWARHAEEANESLRLRNPNAEELREMKRVALERRNTLAAKDEVKAFLAKEREMAAAKHDVEAGEADDSLLVVLGQEMDEMIANQTVQEYVKTRARHEGLKKVKSFDGDNTWLSGMKDDEAKAFMRGLSQEKKTAYSTLAAKWDNLIKQTRQTLVEYELEDQETVDSWAAAFDFYIPLNREDMDGGKGIGQGFSVKGASTKGRTGSYRAVSNILANIVMQRERAIVRGEKSTISRALHGLATANPNKDFWSIEIPPTERTVDPVTGMVVNKADMGFKSRPNVVVNRFINNKGKIEERAVVFNDQDKRALRMAEALKNLDTADLGAILGVSAKITRFFSAMNTQYNVVFGPVNLVRDVQAAALNLSTTPLKGKSTAVLKRIVGIVPQLYKAVRAENKGRPLNTDIAKAWQEMQMEGGTTGFRDMFADSNERAERLRADILQIKKVRGKRAFFALRQWVSDYNDMLENSTRLAVYMEAREAGISKKRAAQLAKDVTLNFNRKGQVATQAGAMYAFFNAAAQGTEKMYRTLTGPAGKKIITGGLMLGAAQTILLAAAGFDEDEPPEFIRERNLIIPIGWKKYITVPMPLGFHVVPNLTRIPTEWALRGFKEPGKAVTEIAAIFAEAFNPLGNAGFSMQTFAPTPMDPFIALGENKDWTGLPIAKQDFNTLKPTPGHTRARDTASWPSEMVSKALNLLTGGNEYVPGMLSPTPDQIDYLIGQVAGGVGRETMKLFNVSRAATRGEASPAYRIPFVGRFYGNSGDMSGVASRYYTNLKRVNRIALELDGIRENGGNVAKFIRRNPEARSIRYTEATYRNIQKLQRAKRRMLEGNASRNRVEAIDRRILETMRRFNERTNPNI